MRQYYSFNILDYFLNNHFICNYHFKWEPPKVQLFFKGVLKMMSHCHLFAFFEI
jgi:hypothetical protein